MNDRQYRKFRTKLYEKYEGSDFVKRIIDEWDPVDLLSHAPNDEYCSEIEKIRCFLFSVDEADALADVIFKIFTESFAEDVFHHNWLACKAIAQKLLLQKHSISV